MNVLIPAPEAQVAAIRAAALGLDSPVTTQLRYGRKTTSPQVAHSPHSPRSDLPVSPQQPRDPKSHAGAALGGQLKAIRKEAGFTSQEAIAATFGTERSVATKAETGELPPTAENLDIWLDACDVTGLHRDAIVALWRLARAKADPSEARMMPYYETEARAHTLRYWAPLLIPGLLQTADYARAVFSAYRHSPSKVDEYVKQRMERQSLLGDDGPSVTVVLWEPVLNNLIGSAEVMRGQMARLVELFEHRRVNIHVLASTLGANMGLGGAIHLATTDAEEVVMIEGFSEDFITSEAARVRAAAATFDGVRADALNRAASLEVLTEAMERWSSS